MDLAAPSMSSSPKRCDGSSDTIESRAGIFVSDTFCLPKLCGKAVCCCPVVVEVMSSTPMVNHHVTTMSGISGRQQQHKQRRRWYLPRSLVVWMTLIILQVAVFTFVWIPNFWNMEGRIEREMRRMLQSHDWWTRNDGDNHTTFDINKVEVAQQLRSPTPESTVSPLEARSKQVATDQHAMNGTNEKDGYDGDGYTNKTAGNSSDTSENRFSDESDSWIAAYTDKNAEIADWEYYPNLPQRVENPTPMKTPSRSECQMYMEHIDTSPPVLGRPSGTACDGYNGVLHIQHFDRGAASGTAFFQFIIGLLQWADQHNYLPWIHIDDGYTRPIWDDFVHNQPRPNSPNNFTMIYGMDIGWARDRNDPGGHTFPGRPYQRKSRLRSKTFPYHGTGVWEHYFLPPNDFVPGDSSCREKPLIRMTNNHIAPGVHVLAPWAPRAWKHTEVEYILRPDLSWTDWFAPQRQHAAEIVQRYIRFNPTIERRAQCAFPDPHFSLGMHIRHGDKYLERKILPPSWFLKYAEAFVNNGGGAIYVATDSSEVLETIANEWPENVSSHVIHQPFVAGRTTNETAAFDLGISAHRTNVEALTDILALSKCTFFLHGLSALSEAVLYLNPSLVVDGRSINLEDKAVYRHERRYVRRFDTALRQYQSGRAGEDRGPNNGDGTEEVNATTGR